MRSKRGVDKAPHPERTTRTGIWDWDLSAGIVEWSPRLARLFGVVPGRVSGNHRTLLRAVHPDDRRALAQALDDAWRQCDGFEHEFRVVHPDGGVRWLVASGKFACGEDGTPSRMIGSVIDVTERKRLEDEARVRQAEIAHLARLSAVGQMAAGIAHELTQPFTAILNFANEALKQLGTGATGPAADNLRDILRETVRASDLVTRVRTFGRKSQPVRGPVDLNAAVKDTVELLRYRLRHHEIRVRLHLCRTLAPALADGVEIQQVLVNLMQNAIDAMREDRGADRRLIVRTAPASPAAVLVRITDSGESSPQNEAAHWFQPFFTTKPEGLGLGLSISQSIIEQHGGEIRATRNAERGMTFEFTLPCINTRNNPK